MMCCVHRIWSVLFFPIKTRCCVLVTSVMIENTRYYTQVISVMIENTGNFDIRMYACFVCLLWFL
uniref:Secreted protein n=1 Tax=Rhizophora mucronata TaxID=61149 RepID=A0A2P2QLP1_RHIMU